MGGYYTKGIPKMHRDGRYISWYRTDIWHTDDARFKEFDKHPNRVLCLTKEDMSDIEDTRNYNSACSPCWLGHIHTVNVHHDRLSNKKDTA